MASDVTGDTVTSNEFTLTGFEKFQNAFGNLQDTRYFIEQIIIVKFMELT